MIVSLPLNTSSKVHNSPRTSVNTEDKAKFMRMFGNSLIKYHPERVLDLLIELVTNAFLKTNTAGPQPVATTEKTTEPVSYIVTQSTKYTPDTFFHLFIGCTNDEVLNVYGSYLEFLVKFISKLPNERVILNATFEFFLKRIKVYESAEFRKYKETQDPRIEEIKTKLMGYLKDDVYQSRLDKNHVLLLFKNYRFTQGVTEICELLGLKTELLNYYIENKDTKMVINFCKKNGGEDPNLWITALNFFCTRVDGDEPGNADRLKKIPEILDAISGLESLSHILVLNILKGNDKIQAGHIKKYFIQKIKQQRAQTQQELEAINENLEAIEEAQKKYKKLKTQAQTFQETKCSSCKEEMSNPSIHFMCGHSFHDSCLEGLECTIHVSKSSNHSGQRPEDHHREANKFPRTDTGVKDLRVRAAQVEEQVRQAG